MHTCGGARHVHDTCRRCKDPARVIHAASEIQAHFPPKHMRPRLRPA